MKLASAWAVMAAIGAFTFIHFDAIRDTLGLKLEPSDFGALASEREAAPARAQDDAAVRRISGTVRLHAGQNGHFETTAYINGRPVEVMVDTGASMVALTWEDARRAGIYLRDSDFKHKVSTANGTARVAAVTLDDVAIEDITVHNVRAVVAEPGNLQTTLLGMTFLSQLARTEMSRGVLLLER
jgi:aspartyl protease family protein